MRTILSLVSTFFGNKDATSSLNKLLLLMVAIGLFVIISFFWNSIESQDKNKINTNMKIEFFKILYDNILLIFLKSFYLLQLYY